jgi:hypothetical protein
MRIAWIILSFTCAQLAQSQNLTGIWTGKRTQGPQGCFPEYFLELHVNFSKDNSIMGNSYSYYNEKLFTKVNFTGRYNPTTKRLVIIESAVLQYSVPAHCIPCIKTYDLTWALNGLEEYFNGDWKGHEMGNAINCPPGKVELHKTNKAVFPVEVFQNDTLSGLQKNMKLQNREKEIVQTVVVDTSAIKIELYDNAEIDGDGISFLNNIVTIKKRIFDRPLPSNNQPQHRLRI